MREGARAIIILAIIPVFMVILATVTTSKLYVMPPLIFSLLVIFAALSTGEKPDASFSLKLDKRIAHIGEEVGGVKVEVTISRGGYGLIMIRGPPIPGTDMAEGFELVRGGTNVHVIFKGFRRVHKEYEYILKAVKRGGPTRGGGVSYIYYHPFGMIESIKENVKISEGIQVLPRVKLISSFQQA